MKQLLTVLLFLTSSALIAGESFIPLDPIRVPSKDLIYKGEVVSAERAAQLQEQGVDLSKLDPMPSEVWNSENAVQVLNESVDDLPIENNQTVAYVSSIASNSGLFRFNVEASAGTEKRIFTVHLDKTLHTYLLKKNILRKLGYKIPAMEFVSNLTIQFETKEEKEKFISREIPEATLGAPSRWVSKGLDAEGKPDETLEITLQDIFVTMPSEKDHYNLAMGVPPRVLTTRTLRSLLVAYALLDLGESTNKFNWSVGKIDNGNIKLPHNQIAEFNPTLDDALWMLRKIQKLERRDFYEITKLAHFPKEVEMLVLEKIISRRNALMAIFKQTAEELHYNPEITFGSKLKDGRLQVMKFDGYASNFSHGSPDSPFDDWGWGILGDVQSIAIDELISRANSELAVFDINTARGELMTDQFENGLESFIETGEFTRQPLGAWVSPVVNGQLILGRDVVVGSYMGTDNMVQLADTFGFGFKIGVQMGFESIDLPYGFGVGVGLNYVKTYAHIKPVKSLKQAFKEPYQNMIVPFVKHMIKKQADRIADLADNPDGLEEEERNEVLSDVMKNLDKYLGVGESLIIQDRISPNITARGTVTYMNTRVSLGVDANALEIKRIHLYRKNGSTLQVYVDNGMSKSLGVSFGVDYFIPVLEVRYKRTGGKYTVDAYSVNIDTDTEVNPDLYRSATGISHLLKSGSAELLDEVKKPYSIANKFFDESTKAKFLHWRHKTLRKSDMYSLLTPKKKETNYVRHSNASQMGLNYEAFVVDIGNYYLGRYLKGLQIRGNTWQNPAQTYFGVAKTKEGRFEARLKGDEEEVDNREMFGEFLTITYRKEGWSIKRSKLMKEVGEWNDKYGKELFAKETLRDATKLKLYNLSLNINVYDNGIEKLKNLSNGDLKKIQRKYKRQRAFSRKCKNIRYRNKIVCGNLKTIMSENDDCKKDVRRGSSKKAAKCLLELAQTLEKSLEFDDFRGIVGADNLYIYGQIQGFRADSETLAEPINSSTIGHIGDRFWNGPVEAVREILGLQNGEFSGSWMRENIR
ncbi:MAG: hypothetical protein KC493_00645 [Bacteriovoracaceae bacterium]|nr:hypothetical protein [Bacteriovoracaceae bacterium]